MRLIENSCAAAQSLKCGVTWCESMLHRRSKHPPLLPCHLLLRIEKHLSLRSKTLWQGLGSFYWKQLLIWPMAVGDEEATAKMSWWVHEFTFIWGVIYSFGISADNQTNKNEKKYPACVWICSVNVHFSHQHLNDWTPKTRCVKMYLFCK